MTAFVPAPVAPPPASPARSGIIPGHLLAMASMIAWAAGLPAAGVVIPLLPAEQLGAVRVSIAALFLLPVWLIADGFRTVLAAPWIRGILIGSLIGLASWTMIIGQTLGGTVMAAVITASMPVFAISLEVALRERKLSWQLVTGIACSMAGGLLALDFGSGDSSSLLIGAGFCCLSILCYTIGSRLTVTALADLSMIGRTALSITGAAIASLVIALTAIALGTEPGDPALWGGKEILALLVFAIMGLSLAQLFWIFAIRRIGIGMTSLHTNGSPFYVMIILWLFFAAPWNWAQAGAAALVAFGVLIAQGVIALPRRAER